MMALRVIKRNNFECGILAFGCQQSAIGNQLGNTGLKIIRLANLKVPPYRLPKADCRKPTATYNAKYSKQFMNPNIQFMDLWLRFVDW
jgi:hypothetical protein